MRRFANGSLDVPGSPQVLFTPGHTLGHCALHFPDRDEPWRGGAAEGVRRARAAGTS